MYLGILGLICLLGGIAIMNYDYSIIGFSISAFGIYLITKKSKK